MKNDIQLIDGRIPKNTECPFRDKCIFAQTQNGACKHKGVEHNVPFSCASARGFLLLHKKAKQ